MLCNANIISWQVLTSKKLCPDFCWDHEAAEQSQQLLQSTNTERYTDVASSRTLMLPDCLLLYKSLLLSYRLLLS